MPQYSPMQSVRALSGIQGAMGGQGLLWEGKEKGLSRRAIQDYVNKQAGKATKAGRGIGMSQFLGKGLGLLAMLATGPGGWIGGAKGLGTLAQVLSGAGVAGGVSKVGGELAAKGLSREAGPDVLYGLEEKEEAESYAHSSVDTLLSSIDPGAVSAAVTTPLEYLTMQMLKSQVPQGKMGGISTGGVQEVLNPLSKEAVKQSVSVGGSTYGAAGLNYAQRQGVGLGTRGRIPLTSQVNASPSAASFWEQLSQLGWTPPR